MACGTSKSMQPGCETSNPAQIRTAIVLVLVTAWSAGVSGQGMRSDLDGVWNVTGSYSPDIALNDDGESRRQAYDFLTDDPHMQCLPTSVTRTMITPSPLMEIRQHDDHVEFNHEFMDVKRRIPIDPQLTAQDAPIADAQYPHLGRSVARYEGENLVVDSSDIHAGVFSTFQWVGYPQSDLMVTTERYIPNGGLMEARITHFDPVFYRTPFTIVITYARTDAPLLEWGCVPEKACADPRACGVDEGEE